MIAHQYIKKSFSDIIVLTTFIYLSLGALKEVIYIYFHVYVIDMYICNVYISLLYS